MIIEETTTYAYKLKYIENVSFNRIRAFAQSFVNELPQELVDDIFFQLNHGLDLLQNEPQMLVYLHSYGKMHEAKLRYAFDQLPEDFREQPKVNIIDYGCGQAIGTMCYADFLANRRLCQTIKSVTLIEPSEICLKRAALHVSQFFPDAKIHTVCKPFDDLTDDDIANSADIPTLHILSNVLDIQAFDLEDFATLINNNLSNYNQFVCVGPYFNYSDKDERMTRFAELLNGNITYSKIFEKGELCDGKTWTAQIVCFSVGNLIKFQPIKQAINNNESILFEGTIDVSTLNNYRCYYRDGHYIILVEFKGNTIEIESNFKLPERIKKFDWAVVSCEYEGKKYTKARILNVYEDVNEELSTEVTDEEIKDGIKDEYGVVYSPDGQRLLRCENESIEEYKIKKGTTVICDLAFNDCESLREITIPNSVISIGESAFWSCKSLQQMTIPNSVTSIGPMAFTECESLQKITIPDSVSFIGDMAFSYCESLQEIIIPKSITTIGNQTFFQCESLQQINIPDSVISIGELAFFQCKSLQDITIPKSITTIGKSAFSGCLSLKQISIHCSINTIGENAFSMCPYIKRIVVLGDEIYGFENKVPKELWEKLYYDCLPF